MRRTVIAKTLSSLSIISLQAALFEICSNNEDSLCRSVHPHMDMQECVIHAWVRMDEFEFGDQREDGKLMEPTRRNNHPIWQRCLGGMVETKARGLKAGRAHSGLQQITGVWKGQRWTGPG